MPTPDYQQQAEALDMKLCFGAEHAIPTERELHEWRVGTIIEYLRTAAEQAASRRDAEQSRYERIGRLFAELWELGAPWPVPKWTCDLHAVEGCDLCRTQTRHRLDPERHE